jgi:hypothetical protein
MRSLDQLNALPDCAWISTNEAALILAVSTRLLMDWRAAGHGPPWNKPVRHVRYQMGPLRAWMLADRRVSA